MQMKNFHSGEFTMDDTPSARLKRAVDSLEGLSVGDAFGQGFFMSFELAARLMGSQQFGKPPYNFQDDFILQELVGSRTTEFIAKPWRWTDDTALALEIVDNLREFEVIEPRSLAISFARRYLADPARGYGGAMHSLLPDLRFGEWQTMAASLFDGSGSFGNGAAMRSAPVGAYFADSPARCAHYAALSSRVTHSHPEGIAGGVAIAMAACFAARSRESGDSIDLIAEVLPFLEESEVKSGLLEAQGIKEMTASQVAARLGAGRGDTVPFCLWCASRHLDNFEEALWETVSGLQDRDTTCAIVGGIVAAKTGTEGIPREWLENREALAEQ
jgi:ADP-ribosylglycohydrolase